MTTEIDYYELLEVERTADASVLKSAYRKMAMKYHPDKTGDAPTAKPSSRPCRKPMRF